MSHAESIPMDGDDPVPPELLVVSNSRQQIVAVEHLLPSHKWRLRPAYSLDQALDLMKERAPRIVLIDRSHCASGAGGLRDWLEGVSAILPVIMVVQETDTDDDAWLMGIGIFRTVRAVDLDGPMLLDLLDAAVEWADRTGRRRPSLQTGPLLMAWQTDGRVLEVSPRLAESLGWPASALTGRPLDELVAPASMALRDRWSEGGSQRLQLIRRNGSRWPVSVVRQPMIGKDGQVQRVIGVFTDITRSSRLDQWAQRRAQLVAQKLKAERANQSKSRFMAAISHDLRQPMHAMGLFVEELRRPLDPSRAAGILEHMAQSLASMESLLDSVLALSRLESAQMTPNLQVFDLEPIMSRLRLNYRAAARAKGLRFGVGSSDAVVMSDPALLERMLSNLVVNAVQYTEQGGVLLTCRRRGGVLRLQVWDTGAGIPPEKQDAVFREFYRIERDNDSRKGVGLGLAIVRSCASMLGLQIGLRSEVGRGTCFTIEVPLPSDTPGPAPEPEVPSAVAAMEPLALFSRSLSNRRVMVETDAQGWVWLGPLLSGWGCDVVTNVRAPQQGSGCPLGLWAPDVAIVTAAPAQTSRVWEFMENLRHTTRPDLPVVLITADTSLLTAREARLQQVVTLNPPIAPARLHGILASVGQTSEQAQVVRS
ncbi:ATP-binding protein [Hydrogenophaga sp. R2]|uniref:sensor histidine kinase n=1 Tax=Hydrogenophaga sp. R2 TaxID=3132827 RepID=UPI003CF1EA2F